MTSSIAGKLVTAFWYTHVTFTITTPLGYTHTHTQTLKILSCYKTLQHNANLK